ncbi:MAG TPA: FHA domain-containing protein [Pseudomonadales bacterium]|nr:FHA domain-containing protein [Pseudomonadales bacterium]
MEEPVVINYRIVLSEERTETFDFTLDSKTFALQDPPVENPPRWAELEFRQCSHCPLNAGTTPYCPVALQLHRVVSRFHNTRSIDRVDLYVNTPERVISREVALQRAISSMIGLLFPTCGCPKTIYMRPMARFHLPLASEEETVFRVTGMYLLAQYFLAGKGQPAEMGFVGLSRIYEDLHILNKAIASRLQHATGSDSAKNAIALLDMYSNLVPVLLDDQLETISSFFDVYQPAYVSDAEAMGNTQFVMPVAELPVPPTWSLHPMHSSMSDKLFTIEGTMVVGRANDCELTFPLASMSRRHASLSVENGILTVKDLGSANGTYVNGQRVEEAQLKDGDQLRLDKLDFTVLCNAS